VILVVPSRVYKINYNLSRLEFLFFTMTSLETTPILPSEIRLSEQSKDTLLGERLASDLGDVNSVKGSANVYALTHIQKECLTKDDKDPNSSWDALHDALWRTPYIDYADEWVSTAMFYTKQFLVRAFNKTISNSNARKMNMHLLKDKNWPAYDRHTTRTRGEICLWE